MREKGNDHDPIVSVIVITYNSSQFVLETLESVKAQTYKNIELIISDDGSVDDTQTKCKKWLDINNSRFYNHGLISSRRNTGISPNCNRGVEASTGELIKIIAGDDILFTNCIEECIIFSNRNPLIKWFTSKIGFINTTVQSLNNDRKEKDYSLFFNEIRNKSVEKQTMIYLKSLHKSNIPAPAICYKKEIFNDHQFNENYPFWEDVPMVLSIFAGGHNVGIINKKLVNYRNDVNPTSSYSRFNLYINPKYYESRKRYFKDVLSKYFIENKLWLSCWHHKIQLYVYKNALKQSDKKNNYTLQTKLFWLLSPLAIGVFIKIILTNIQNKISKFRNHFAF